MSVYRTIGPLVSLLTVTLRGVSNKHCLLSLFSVKTGIKFDLTKSEFT